MQSLLKTLLLIFAVCQLAVSAKAQVQSPSRLAFSAKITFQAYGLPFKNINGSFKNVGGAIGIDYAYNKSRTWWQTFTIGYQSHRQHEQSVYLNTQLAYRPVLFKVLEPTVALGVGRLLSFSNTKSPFYEQEEGTWQKSSKQYQAHWQVPISVSMGYRLKPKGATAITPFIGYEATPVIKYNSAFAVLPYSLINVGTRIQFLNNHKLNQ